MAKKQRTGLNSLVPQQIPTGAQSNIFAGRVRYAMLDDKTQPEAFKKFGEWSSIGSIFFDKINQPNTDPQFSTDNYAQALFPNQSVVPLENEIVYIMAMPNSDIQSNVNDLSYYYFQPINWIWYSIMMNTIPKINRLKIMLYQIQLMVMPYQNLNKQIMKKQQQVL